MKRSSGFTLLELLIVIAIMTTTVTAGYGAFVQFKSSKDQDIASEDFKNMLYEAKADTLSSVGYATYCNASQKFTGYQVVVNSDTKTYKLQIVCSGTAISPALQSKTFPSSLDGIAISQTDSGGNITKIYNANILFNYPEGTVSNYYSVTLNGKNKDAVIEVDTNGIIFTQN